MGCWRVGCESSATGCAADASIGEHAPQIAGFSSLRVYEGKIVRSNEKLEEELAQVQAELASLKVLLMLLLLWVVVVGTTALCKAVHLAFFGPLVALSVLLLMFE